MLPAAVYWVNDKGFIEHYNKKAAELWGYYPSYGDPEKRYNGAYKVFSLDGEYIPPDKLPLVEVLEKGIFVKDKEMVLETPDGIRIVVNVNISPIYDKKGFLIGAIDCFHDITHKKEIEGSLAKKNKELSKINNDLDNFIYTASHDLKAPVSNIEGLVDTLKDILKEKNIKDEDIDSVLGMIDSSVFRFCKTVSSLTDISKVQKNVQDDVYGIDVFDVIQDVCFDINNLTTACDAKISIDTSVCPVIRFSKKNLRSIIYNLLTNAVKYRSPGRTPVIGIRTYSLDEYSVLEVRDNGLGLKEDSFDKIFAMFKRLHDHIEGNGIGLYILKRMVDNADGKIEVESEEGKGSTFRIFLKNLSAI